MVAELEKTTFQQTEIGEIPSDWEVDQIGKLIRLISGQHILSQDYNQDGEGVPYLTGPADFGLIFPLISKWTNKPKATALKDDILITVKGDGVGKINLLNVEKVAISRQLMAIHSQTVNGLYLYQYLKGKYSYFQELSTGSTVPGLSRDDINRCVIPLPPTLAEQTAIATALTDADALITQLEKLIAKKKAITQGAMQELLKPKEGWEEKKFGEVALSISSGKSKTQYKEGAYPIYGSTGIIGRNSSFDYEGIKILVARVGANAGMSNRVHGKYCVSDNTLMLSLRPQFDINFVFYQLISFQLNSLVFGSGQPLITGSQLKSLKFSYPKIKHEQTRIAQILSDMDAEIEKLEQRLAKQKMLKQGMMQVLLTGKIRLV